MGLDVDFGGLVFLEECLVFKSSVNFENKTKVYCGKPKYFIFFLPEIVFP